MRVWQHRSMVFLAAAALCMGAFGSGVVRRKGGGMDGWIITADFQNFGKRGIFWQTVRTGFLTGCIRR